MITNGKHIVTLAVQARDYEADEYGMPMGEGRKLYVACIRAARAAMGDSIVNARDAVLGAGLKEARGRTLMTFLVDDAGLGRLYLLERGSQLPFMSGEMPATIFEIGRVDTISGAVISAVTS